jgi:hypothetical protein
VLLVAAAVVVIVSGSAARAGADAPVPATSPAEPTMAQLVARARSMEAASPHAAPAVVPPDSIPLSSGFSDDPNDATAPDDPRGDIVQGAAGENLLGTRFDVTMSTPSDPATDPNWRGTSSVAWLLDTNFDGHIDTAAIFENFNGVFEAAVISFLNNALFCPGTVSYDGTTIHVVFPHCEIGIFRWRAESEYDTTPGNQNRRTRVRHCAQLGILRREPECAGATSSNAATARPSHWVSRFNSRPTPGSFRRSPRFRSPRVETV